MLVLIGVTKESPKEMLAVRNGHRESELSWLGVLRDLKRRGLAITPMLAFGMVGSVLCRVAKRMAEDG